MLLKCELVTANRLVPHLESRRAFATFCLSKKTDSNGEDIICFVVFAAKSKIGQKYLVKNNIQQVLSKFVCEGKLTLCMKEPPHDLRISKADPVVLKKFLHVVKLAFRGADTSSVLKEINPIDNLKNVDLEKPKTALTVLSRAEYPIKAGFPSSLEKLSVNRCLLKKFDERILRLRNLTYLNLSDNQLVTLPPDISKLMSLRSVCLARNRFEDVPSCFLRGAVASQLKLLDISENKIKFLSNRFGNLREVVTVKLERNEIQFLNVNIGSMRKLQHLNLSDNLIKVLPWSFSQLQLQDLDLSGNLFHVDADMELNADSLLDVPTLFELTARFILKECMSIPEDDIPSMVLQRLDNFKICPCGNFCLTSYVPYIRTFDVAHISPSVVFGESAVPGKRNMAKMIGYLCCRKCYKKWQDNPNALWK